jgi:hypothetical protein
MYRIYKYSNNFFRVNLLKKSYFTTSTRTIKEKEKITSLTKCLKESIKVIIKFKNLDIFIAHCNNRYNFNFIK